MADESKPFDPLAVENVGVTLAVQLVTQVPSPMPPTTRFSGAGVYALYYAGSHKAYRKLVKLDEGRFRYPIYIGKAVRENAKQGFSPRPETRSKLYDRICEHAASIEAVGAIDLKDCRCRFLVLNDAYIALAESVMIRVFRPPWNGMGFGSKVVGNPRMAGGHRCGTLCIRGGVVALREMLLEQAKRRLELIAVLMN